MKKNLLILISSVILLFGCSSSGNEGAENEYPNDDIEIINPFPPGGTTDSTIRVFTKVLPKYLPNDVNVIVRNVPGGTGVVGTTQSLEKEPDGYNLLYAPTATVALQKLFGKADYSYEDFTAISNLEATPSALVVHKDSPFETYEEMLDYIKENPGEFTYGTPGTASSAHLSMEAFNLTEDVKTKMVPFDGNADSMSALLGGNIDSAIQQVPDITEYLDSEEVRILTYLGHNKLEGYEDPPLLEDFGHEAILPDPAAGVFAPKELPDEIAETIAEAFQKASEDPEVIEYYESLDISVGSLTPEKAGEDVKAEYEVAEEVMEKLDLDLE